MPCSGCHGHVLAFTRRCFASAAELFVGIIAQVSIGVVANKIVADVAGPVLKFWVYPFAPTYRDFGIVFAVQCDPLTVQPTHFAFKLFPCSWRHLGI